MKLLFTGYEQTFWVESQAFTPRIHPSDGNVVPFELDLSSSSSLQWTEPQTDQKILWELQTDLWKSPFQDEGEIRAFERAIDHFVDTLYRKFEQQTFGVLIYKGRFDFPRDLVKSVCARLPDEIFPFLALDGSDLSFEDFFHQLKREELTHFGLILKGGDHPYALPAIGWDQPSPLGFYSNEVQEVLPQLRIPLALCQPIEGSFSLPDEPCRVIPEQLLIYEWDGVDELITSTLSEEGRRKVNGFLATGGLERV